MTRGVYFHFITLFFPTAFLPSSHYLFSFYLSAHCLLPNFPYNPLSTTHFPFNLSAYNPLPLLPYYPLPTTQFSLLPTSRYPFSLLPFCLLPSPYFPFYPPCSPQKILSATSCTCALVVHPTHPHFTLKILIPGKHSKQHTQTIHRIFYRNGTNAQIENFIRIIPYNRLFY